MKRLAWIALMTATGCVHFPYVDSETNPARADSRKPAAKSDHAPATTSANKLFKITADEVTQDNAHEVADQLLKEMEGGAPAKNQ